jgi:uncharacterized protein (TIGR03067 family)
MSKPLAVLALAAALLAAADRGQGGDKRTDADKLAGNWKLIAAESQGQQAPDDVIKSLKWTVAGDKITAKGPEGKSFTSTFKLYPAKNPKAIDLTNPDRKETLQGIYELTGGQLKICFAAPGERRPESFVTKEDLKVVLFVFRREKG